MQKLYVSVVTLSTQDNAKLLQKLKSGFEKTISRSKYQSGPKTHAQNQYLNHLIDDYFDIRTHWVALYALNNNVTYFDSFGVKHIPKEIKKIIGNKNIQTNIFRIQVYDTVMGEYFCIGFIDFMLKGKSITDFTYLFSPNSLKK